MPGLGYPPGGCFLWIFLAVITLGSAGSSTAETITVATASDVSDGDTSSISALLAFMGNDGFISLREAIHAANNTANTGLPDEIHFDIGAGGVQTITLNSALPDLLEAVVIDGTTQPNYSGTPLIEIDGDELENSGLRVGVGGGGSTILALAIGNFEGHAVALDGDGGNTLKDSFIGVRADGSTLWRNEDHNVDLFSNGNIIRGNTIVAGDNAGIALTGSDAYGNILRGNFIGTNSGGAAGMGNSGVGILLWDGPAGNTIGGSLAADRNVIVGNDHGIVINGAGSDGNQIQGNYIGLAPDGVSALGNLADGIRLLDGASGNTIGGPDAGEGNVVSGNGNFGIALIGSGTDSNQVWGNFVGTDAAGLIDRGNGTDGICLRSGARDNTVGGAGLGYGNLISGNDNDGIWITDSGTGNNTIQGNKVGLDAGGGAMGNSYHGIALQGGSSDNQIGGIDAGQGNTFAHNFWDGITVEHGGNGNALLGNLIFSNGDLGIDLVGGIEDGFDVTANDLGPPHDVDTGPNNLQNFPALTSAGTNQSWTIFIEGTINTAASTEYRIEFFASTVADVSGYGQGETYLGSVDVTTDTSGKASFDQQVSAAVPVGAFISATATDPGGNTSEFCQNISATLLAAYEISGVVFEDADFAGMATNWDSGVNDVGHSSVDVELYTENDVYVASVTTGVGGDFLFSGVPNGIYKVRARSATLGDSDTPPAGGFNADVPAIWAYPLPDMTWAHDAALIGGQDPTVDDTATGDNAGPGDTWVKVTVSGAPVPEVNLGFSYDLVVNVDDDANADNVRSGQGTLRQFIKNSNATAGVNKSWFQIPGS